MPGAAQPLVRPAGIRPAVAPHLSHNQGAPGSNTPHISFPQPKGPAKPLALSVPRVSEPLFYSLSHGFRPPDRRSINKGIHELRRNLQLILDDFKKGSR
jgi:hypothetical protein